MMTVISMDLAPANIRGELSKWFLEVKPGVFIGNVNARIRDLLWHRICESQSVTGAVMAYPSNNEQGYTFILAGTPKRKTIDLDGLLLIKIE